MNVTIEQFLGKLVEWLQKGGDLAAKELPIIGAEIVKYYLAYSLINIVVLSSIVWLGIWASRKWWFFCEEENYGEAKVLLVLSGTIIILCTIFIFNHAQTAAKAAFAPRLLLLEKVKDLITPQASCK